MTAPLATPLLLPSEYNAAVVSGAFTTANLSQQLRWLVQTSDYIQSTCRRRFDERVDIRKYTSFLERDGGDLETQWDLLLDDDLKTPQQISQRVPVGIDVTIDDGVDVSIDSCRFLTSNRFIGTSVRAYDTVHINQYSGNFFYMGGVDPFESIWVKGLWGYGGQWVNTATTVATEQDASSTSLAVASGTVLEAGMVLKVGTEYEYVESVAVNTATVTRAYNDSTAAIHAVSSAVYRWQALPTVSDLVRRLVQWKLEQVKSPAAGNVTVGDFTFPVDMAGLPKDIYLIFRDAKLQRLPMAKGV
jgi:hypothetical protein